MIAYHLLNENYLYWSEKMSCYRRISSHSWDYEILIWYSNYTATITVSNNALPGPYTLFLFANSTFPSEQLIKPKTNISSSDVRFSHLNTSQVQNILTQTSMVLTINEPPSFVDQIGSGWQKLGGPVSFFYGIIAGISPWIYYKIRKSVKTRKNSKD